MIDLQLSRKHYLASCCSRQQTCTLSLTYIHIQIALDLKTGIIPFNKKSNARFRLHYFCAFYNGWYFIHSAIISCPVTVRRLTTLQVWPATNHHSGPRWGEGSRNCQKGASRNKELQKHDILFCGLVFHAASRFCFVF